MMVYNQNTSGIHTKVTYFLWFIIQVSTIPSPSNGDNSILFFSPDTGNTEVFLPAERLVFAAWLEISVGGETSGGIKETLFFEESRWPIF